MKSLKTLALSLALMTATSALAAEVTCTPPNPQRFAYLQTRDLRVDESCSNARYSIYINGNRWTTYYGGELCEQARARMEGLFLAYHVVEFRPAIFGSDNNFRAVPIANTTTNVDILASLIRRDNRLEDHITDLETTNQTLRAELCDRVNHRRQRELGCQ